jgi:hypothetical protein
MSLGARHALDCSPASVVKRDPDLGSLPVLDLSPDKSLTRAAALLSVRGSRPRKFECPSALSRGGRRPLTPLSPCGGRFPLSPAGGLSFGRTNPERQAHRPLLVQRRRRLGRLLTDGLAFPAEAEACSWPHSERWQARSERPSRPPWRRRVCRAPRHGECLAAREWLSFLRSLSRKRRR